MKRIHLTLSFAALLALASCGGQQSTPCEPTKPQEPTKITYGHYTLKDSVTDLAEIEGYPWVNSSIAGMLGKVEKPEAKHDFFGYANYEEFQNNPLPENEKRAGGKIMESKNVTDGQIKEIMTGDDTSVQAVLRMLKTGAKDKILADVSDLLTPATAASAAQSFLSSKAMFEGPSRIITMQVDESGKIHLSFDLNSSHVNLPLIIYMLSSSGRSQEYISALVSYLTMIGLGQEEAANIVNATGSTLMPAIVAQTQASVEPHHTTVGQMDYDFGPIDLKAALLDLGFAQGTEVTMTDQAYRYLASLAGADIDLLAKSLAFTRAFDNRFLVGAANFRDLAVNHFAGLQGLEDPNIHGDSSDDEVAQELYLKAFPKAFDQIYIGKYIKDSTKQRIDDLIGDVIDEYQVLFEEQEWLADETKQAAKEKLSNMWHMSFYSDGFMDEGNRFAVTASDAMGLADDYYDWHAGIMSSCPWSGSILTHSMSTTTINAFYSPGDNAFGIFHGVCASYIEDENLSKEKLYGYIGMVIGHEISHGFDSSGSSYDKNGQKNDWWTADDKAAFQSKVAKIADYYTNAIHGYHDHNYNGANLTGEIIADMGGLRVMLRLAEKEKSFDYDEFFRAIAENFAIQGTREYGLYRIVADNHPEEYLRINVTFGQFDKFAETYGVKEGDGMYVAPENRLAIW